MSVGGEIPDDIAISPLRIVKVSVRLSVIERRPTRLIIPDASELVLRLSRKRLAILLITGSASASIFTGIDTLFDFFKFQIA